uniref:Uncharacterized protein n=1 Tax=Myotis myotis TaxID=51298 RepID=A0A7J7S2F3_MYOMY|nr:hypothetical protein mMyoMyo1_010062 [Myotis myotis]
MEKPLCFSEPDCYPPQWKHRDSTCFPARRRVPAAAPARGTSIGQPPSLLSGADEPRWRASQRMSWHLGNHVNSQVWIGAGSWLSHQAQGNLGSAFMSCRGDAGKGVESTRADARPWKAVSACLPLSSLALPETFCRVGRRRGPRAPGSYKGDV